MYWLSSMLSKYLQSEFAHSRGSQKKLAEAFEERTILIPPEDIQFVMAAQYDLEHFKRLWQAAVMGFKRPMNFQSHCARDSSIRRNADWHGSDGW